MKRAAQPVLPVLTRIIGLLFVIASPLAVAAPSGSTVLLGQGSVVQTGSQTTVTQTTSSLAINWRSFNVGATESVRFVQPSAQSVVLNRVVGAEPSSILGQISANGQVFLVNPNGVLFGRSSQVNVGGLVATTLGISNEEFAAGAYRFAKGAAAGSVSNTGSLSSAGGYVALIAPQASNGGTINTPGGSTAILAGDQVTLQLSGNRLIGASVDVAAVNALAANYDAIRAPDGSVLLSARARDALLSTVVNNIGVIEANSATQRGGTVVLSGGPSGTAHAGGSISANGTTGGSVRITGENVRVSGLVSASGPTGGGEILVGGDYKGANAAVPNAATTGVESTATLVTDATANGNGGKIIVWSRVNTRFQGQASAKGGPLGGNGGLVETAGPSLNLTGGRVDVSARLGRPGAWLTD